MALNYLELGAMANGRPARMARYFAQTVHTPGAVAIVATFNARDWRAYIGSCDSYRDYEGAADQVAAWGVKLSEADARHYFPDVTLPYAAD